MRITELLKKENISDAERSEYARIIENTAEKLSNLVGNILKLNKLENQSIVPEVEKYDLCRQLCGCILQFEDIWEEKGIEVEAEIEERRKRFVPVEKDVKSPFLRRYAKLVTSAATGGAYKKI